MAKIAKRAGPRPYRSLGTTSDGVVILTPKVAPTHFKAGEIRRIIARLKREEADREAREATAQARAPSSPKKA
ncbi:hypothetical protein DA075_06855 [Methylobacterium currus]|uniref:Uncharacterized protein n=1 Tax=Methylobacterium currus TaxID=2051553 RepID=A0A2R4WGL7_9HYPH|nr:hypothetical protein [Methylobacterium currus]AWB20673.1 hypothetical protein DA075_06855 [Methylobacterium currus]UHC14577.1 hypothetical protein LRS73_18725 [Methylobacterium currus]